MQHQRTPKSRSFSDFIKAKATDVEHKEAIIATYFNSGPMYLKDDTHFWCSEKNFKKCLIGDFNQTKSNDHTAFKSYLKNIFLPKKRTTRKDDFTVRFVVDAEQIVCGSKKSPKPK